MKEKEINDNLEKIINEIKTNEKGLIISKENIFNIIKNVINDEKYVELFMKIFKGNKFKIGQLDNGDIFIEENMGKKDSIKLKFNVDTYLLVIKFLLYKRLYESKKDKQSVRLKEVIEIEKTLGLLK